MPSPLPYASPIVAERPTYLPRFRRPPLAEVAMSVVFQPLRTMTGAHHGLYWETIRERFPTSADQPPIDTVYETEGGPEGPALEIRFGSPQLRSFFRSADDEELIQVQADRFVHNWRKGDGHYPHFEQLWADFSLHWEGFTAFASTHGLGRPVPEQVELTYVNLVDDRSLPESLTVGGPQRLQLPGAPPDTALRAEEFQTALRYRLTGEPLARLYATVAPRGPAWMLEITVRSRLADDDQKFGDAFFRARTAVDTAFSALTTTTAQTAWGIISS